MVMHEYTFDVAFVKNSGLSLVDLYTELFFFLIFFFFLPIFRWDSTAGLLPYSWIWNVAHSRNGNRQGALVVVSACIAKNITLSYTRYTSRDTHAYSTYVQWCIWVRWNLSEADPEQAGNLSIMEMVSSGYRNKLCHEYIIKLDKSATCQKRNVYQALCEIPL